MTKGFKRLGADPDAPGTGVLKMNPKETADMDNPDVEAAVERLGKVFDLSVPYDVETRVDKKGVKYVCLVPKGAEPELPDGESKGEESGENMGLTSSEKKKDTKKAKPKKDKDEGKPDSEDGDGMADADSA